MKKLLALLAFAALAIVVPVAVSAQSPAASSGQGLVGTWQGTLTFGANTMRIGLVVTAAGAGSYSAQLVNIDQDGATIPVQQVVLTGSALHLEIAVIKGIYDGTLSANGQQLTGTFAQGMPLPLNFTRVAKLDTPPIFDEAAKADVRAVIETYFRSFTLKDYAALGGTFQTPFIIWGVGGPPLVLTSVEDAVGRLRGTREGLEATDYAVSRTARMIITPLSSSAALVDIHWRRDKKDGTLFGEGAEILTVVRTPNGWRITGNMARQLSSFGKSF